MPAPTITPKDFAAKWGKIQQKERSVAQSHFNDLCRLVGHPTPLDMDPTGDTFSFEMQTDKPGGESGFADVVFRGRFIMEYKGHDKDLTAAYRQLQLYRDTLDNPPLLITSDTHIVEIYTNFTDRPVVKTTVTLSDIAAGPGVDILRRVFTDPDSFRPERTREVITKASAASFLAVAEQMKAHQRLTGEAYTAERLAHFLVRLLFCLFAEDLQLLPDKIFSQTVKAQGGDFAELQPVLKQLFATMRDGGSFGLWRIRHFNGTLFDDDFVPTIPHDLARALLRAANEDWSAVDPSIFGTIFERVIDPDKRAQLGAHYTSQQDIMLIVGPVLMDPLRREWDELRRDLTLPDLTGRGDLSGLRDETPHQRLQTFADKIAATRVLDPACGSGNFLYMALRQLLDLQKEVIVYAARKDLPAIPLTVSPQQLYGIEINPYAHELAQITAWIGYLQWRAENGFAEMADPVLQPLHNIRRMDAILAYNEAGNPVEPEWPAAEVIIGNPPFLGGQKLRSEFGDNYVDQLFKVYESKAPRTGDLVVYWFAKAWSNIQQNYSNRAGLIATQSIRSPLSRSVLDTIASNGSIFMAWSDRPWVLDGAAVRVAMVGFDGGNESNRLLNGIQSKRINADLTSSIDVTEAQVLEENADLSYQGSMIGGPFQIAESIALTWLGQENPDGKTNSDVVRPYVTGSDVLRHTEREWIVDFGPDMPVERAAEYEAPFQFVQTNVYPERQNNRRATRRQRWWIHSDPQPSMRKSISSLDRYIATTRVAKHRIFVWLDQNVLCSNKLIVIARSDNYFFGLLHSHVHEVWSLATSSRHGVGNDPAYTPTTSFETYPFPWPPGREPGLAGEDLTGFENLSGLGVGGSGLGEDTQLVATIAHWSRALTTWRDAWLNPPPPAKGTIDVAYDRLLKARTLTNLYNGLVYYREHQGPTFDRTAFDTVTRKSVSRVEIQELDDIHRALDAAVLRAYGWPTDLTDEQLLERLLALNLQRAAEQA